MQLASYAKINLYLEILAELPDNYHQIETLLCSVSVCDTLKYALTKKRHVKMWSNLPEMVSGDNLVLQVANYLQREFQPDQGVEIHLEKHIPLAAGLGGGSSNAANVIRALNSLWNLQLTLAEMEDIAAGFGSDVPFFLHGGTAWATNRGEKITPCADLDIRNILLVNPNVRISSGEAYRMAPVPACSDRHGFQQANWHKCCFNRLESALCAQYPVVDQVLERLRSAGAEPAMMSGSGSTCFGIFPTADQAQKCQASFDQAGHWTQIVRTIKRKEYQDVFQT